MRNVHCRTWNMARWLKNEKKEKLTYWTWNMARNTEKRGKWDINLVWSGIWGENLQMRKMWNPHVRTWNMIRNNEKRAKRNTLCRTWNMGRNSETCEIWKIHTIGPGFWREKWQTWKMRNTHGRTWNMARSTEKLKRWEMPTVVPGILRETWKTWKMRNTQCNDLEYVEKTDKGETWENHGRTWNMERNLKNM